MALYAIGDLHLSLTADKPMEVFGPAWENDTERIGDALSQLTADDVLVLAGDTSWGISLEETAAVGDSMNDYQMIEMAEVGVAMGNADEKVKKIADRVCESVEEDGVIRELERMGIC